MNIASIDIGTNTILLLIVSVDIKKKTYEVLLNKYSAPRIGKNLKEHQPFPLENLNRMFDILNYYMFEIGKYDCEEVLATATSAFRLASDAKNIVHYIQGKYGFEINIVDGDEEARLSYIGLGTDEEKKLIIDIGGGSIEVISGDKEKINFQKSFNTGAVKIKEFFVKYDPPTSSELTRINEYLDKELIELNDFKPEINNAYAVAGTPVTLAFILSNSKEFNEEIIDGFIIYKADVEVIIDDMKRLKAEDIFKTYGSIMVGREDIILYGSLILLKIMELLKLDKVICSTKGIRYGAIQDYISKLDQG